MATQPAETGLPSTYEPVWLCHLIHMVQKTDRDRWKTTMHNIRNNSNQFEKRIYTSSSLVGPGIR